MSLVEGAAASRNVSQDALIDEPLPPIETESGKRA